MMQRVQVHVELLYPWRYYEVYAIVVRTVLIIGGRGIIGEKIGPGGYIGGLPIVQFCKIRKQ